VRAHLDPDVLFAVERDPHRRPLFARALGDEEADLAADGRRVGRLGQAAVDAAVARQVDRRAVRGVFRHQDLDDGFGVLEDLVEEPEQLGAFHPGQVLVDDEDIDLGQGLDQVDGFDAARRGVDRIDVPEGPLELLEIAEVVVDDEDDGRGSGLRLVHVLAGHLRSALPGGSPI
jgi:hypothetical protein